MLLTVQPGNKTRRAEDRRYGFMVAIVDSGQYPLQSAFGVHLAKRRQRADKVANLSVGLRLRGLVAAGLATHVNALGQHCVDVVDGGVGLVDGLGTSVELAAQAAANWFRFSSGMVNFMPLGVATRS